MDRAWGPAPLHCMQLMRLWQHEAFFLSSSSSGRETFFSCDPDRHQRLHFQVRKKVAFRGPKTIIAAHEAHHTTGASVHKLQIVRGFQLMSEAINAGV